MHAVAVAPFPYKRALEDGRTVVQRHWPSGPSLELLNDGNVGQHFTLLLEQKSNDTVEHLSTLLVHNKRVRRASIPS